MTCVNDRGSTYLHHDVEYYGVDVVERLEHEAGPVTLGKCLCTYLRNSFDTIKWTAVKAPYHHADAQLAEQPLIFGGSLYYYEGREPLRGSASQKT